MKFQALFFGVSQGDGVSMSSSCLSCGCHSDDVLNNDRMVCNKSISYGFILYQMQSKMNNAVFFLYDKLATAMLK